MPFQITTSAFSAGGVIPRRFTCDGSDVSPQLKWKNAPAATESLALIMDDPDAPAGTWVHWVLYNLPSSANGTGGTLRSLTRCDNQHSER
jgi:Raf kinase inhibitor-like YbhB/YbcL family protein